MALDLPALGLQRPKLEEPALDPEDAEASAEAAGEAVPLISPDDGPTPAGSDTTTDSHDEAGEQDC